MTPTIIILALIAAFLGLRLYSVLGKHGRDSEPALPQADDRRPAPVAHAPGSVADAPRTAAPVPAQEMVYEPAAEIGIRAILSADRNFDVGRFVNGSKAAYRMILEAYWKGEKDQLRYLCDDDVYESFAEAIDGRVARGEVLENRLVRIDEARIVDASYDHPMARISVRFDADIAALVKDADGNVIGGSLTDAVETHDVWTFYRDVKSGDRNWKLDETDEV